MYEIQVVNDKLSSALGYCFLRVHDRWPKAALRRPEGQICTSLVMLYLQSNPGECRIYRSLDELYARDLFSCPVPRLILQLDGDLLQIEGRDGGEPLADWLAALPFWKFKVTDSGRLAVTHVR